MERENLQKISVNTSLSLEFDSYEHDFSRR